MDDQNKKYIAKLKRYCMETAGEIHDIVEERLWTDYQQLPELSKKLINQINDLNKEKQL